MSATAVKGFISDIAKQDVKGCLARLKAGASASVRQVLVDVGEMLAS